MTKPKYKIGDRIFGSPFIIRGVMRETNGNYRYFVQVGQADNTFVANSSQLENAIKLIQNSVVNFRPD